MEILQSESQITQVQSPAGPRGHCVVSGPQPPGAGGDSSHLRGPLGSWMAGGCSRKSSTCQILNTKYPDRHGGHLM